MSTQPERTWANKVRRIERELILLLGRPHPHSPGLDAHIGQLQQQLDTLRKTGPTRPTNQPAKPANKSGNTARGGK